MATLIPTLGSCKPRMTSGERRTAELLERKLDEDYLLWYDVPVGPQRLHPDFVVLHPRRGLLVLEVKDWRIASLVQADKTHWVIHGEVGPKTVLSPLEQARQVAQAVVNALARDPQLVHAQGPGQGKLVFPWSYGVVLTRITRAQLQQSGLTEALEPHRVLCQDEMDAAMEPEALQSRLWDMFPYGMRGVLSLPQIDRVRWILFPEVRVQSPVQLELLEAAPAANSDGAQALQPGQTEGRAFAEPELPDLMRVMDLQQEQLARSLGEGHRVIHGVAGSGKTMLLAYRAEHLARLYGGSGGAAPVLLLCYNEPLARQLAAVMAARGVADRVQAVHFHKWCRDQLVAYGQDLPPANLPVAEKMAELVQRVIQGVQRRQIPSGQYRAVLVDEGHDFAPEWFKLLVQMVDPATNNLLVMVDDAQTLYGHAKKRSFSFKSVGIQAQGRTTVLKINYRNTRQILHVARLVADAFGAADAPVGTVGAPADAGGQTPSAGAQAAGVEDRAPLLQPLSSGREGPPPLLIHLPSLPEEAERVADVLAAAHQEGLAWGEMAVLCPTGEIRDLCARTLARRQLPVLNLTPRERVPYAPTSDKVRVMSMTLAKGLEFALVALVGVGHMPAAGGDVRDAARLFYVAATRATQRLVLGLSGPGPFVPRLLEGLRAA